MKPLIEFLKSPASYPHPVDNTILIHTHASIVVLAGNRAYKIKKPVRFSFLDFSSLKKRKYVLQKELLLNKRLTTNIYLNVLPITYENGKYILNGKDKKIVEYALEMKRMEEGYFLNQILSQNKINNKLFQLITQKLCNYYSEFKTTEEISKNGTIESIRLNTGDNFKYIKKCIGKTIDIITYDSIYTFTEKFYKFNETLFQRRIKEGMIRDCHGDLRCEHIHIKNNSVNIFDCIEFNTRFRYIDIANDLAFLSMDIDSRGHYAEADKLRSKFAETLNDGQLENLWDFYSCYRACVRGKVESFKSIDKSVESNEQIKAEHSARLFYSLALKYACTGIKPFVLICCGNIATGKSTLATELSKYLNIKVYSSDKIRKINAGLIPDQRSNESVRKKIYSKKASLELYNNLAQLCKKEINKYNSVILDATFSKLIYRKILTGLLKKQSINYIFIECYAKESIIKKRLLKRERQYGVISDARLEDYEKISKAYEPFTGQAINKYILLNTEGKIQVVLKKAFEELILKNIKKINLELNK